MKVIILSIALISTINASQRLLQSASGPCTYIQCKNGEFCIKVPYFPAKCVSCVGTVCPYGQNCVEGVGCKDTCDYNKEYKTCACAEKCGDTRLQTCTKQNCVEGCFCSEEDHILDEYGNCIKKNECPTYKPTSAPTAVTTGGTSFVHSSSVINLYKRWFE